MDKKISQLTAATTPLTGAEELAIVQSGVTKKTTIEDVKGYKVYTALLTQSGGDNNTLVSNEPLIIGVTYLIDNNEGGTADFTNVGAPNNNNGTYFVATGTTPNSWGSTNSAEIFYNTGAPVVTVLENTIGNITWSYVGTGNYLATLTGAFPYDKTFITTPSQFVYLDANGAGVGAQVNPVDNINVYSVDGGSNASGIINGTPIEIRVYN